MKRLFALCVVAILGLFLCPALFAAEEDKAASKEALQALNDFIGSWNGNGGPTNKARPESKELWKETISWGWRFKGDDAWLTMTIDKGKYFKSGEMRYLPSKKRYQLTLTTSDDKKLEYSGQLKDEILILERLDAATKETQRIKMNLAAEGIRFIYRVEHKPEGRTLFVQDYQVACTREGESLGVKEKKNECIVSGGLGTIPVAYNGVTYWVCCSGCKDAFTENPAKYVKEYEAKKAKK